MHSTFDHSFVQGQSTSFNIYVNERYSIILVQPIQKNGLLVWYNNLHLVPQLKSLHRKIGWRAFFGTPCIGRKEFEIQKMQYDVRLQIIQFEEEIMQENVLIVNYSVNKKC